MVQPVFPYTGTPLQSALYQPNNSTLISQINYSWASHAYTTGPEPRALPYVSQVTRSQYEVGGTVNGRLIRTITRQNSVDASSGIVYDSTTTTTEAATANGVQSGAAYVSRVYQPVASFATDSGPCVRPGRIEVTNSHNQLGGTAITRTTTIDWDTANCRPTQATVEPGDAQLQLTQAFAYDDFGNVSSATITGTGMAARTTALSWGGAGQFPIQVTDALGKSTDLTWDYSLGRPASVRDPNSIQASWSYDLFGRRTREDRPDGTATTWSYENCSGSTCASARNKLIVTQTHWSSSTQAITDQRTYTDSFDRVIALSSRMISGAYNRVDIEYDALGRLHRQSAPCWWSACSQYWTTFDYDALDRLVQVSRPSSDSDATPQIVHNYYEGLSTRSVDPLNKQSTKVADALGALTRSIDHDGYYQSFGYDAFGNLLLVTDSLGNTLAANTFNVRGMRTAQTDIAAGNWTYAVDALGEIVSQTDAKLQQTTFEYDALGRLKKRTEPEGIAQWAWGDVAADHNIGRLRRVDGPGYAEEYAYDGAGRPITTTIYSDQTYSIDYAYNNAGDLATLTYPASTAAPRFAMLYEYQNGLLARIKDAAAPSTVFWGANDTDASGNIISETLGSGVATIRGFNAVTGRIDYVQSGTGGSIQSIGYSWDGAGNLTQRHDDRQGLTETFTYDNLHRLTGVTGPDPLTAAYDARGNMLSQTGAVSAGNGHTITWYSYNLPNLISDPANNSSQFSYAPDRSRWKQVASYGGTTEQTIYVGGLVEKVALNGVTSWKHYIAGSSGLAAVYTRKSTGTSETHYLTGDHLGSISAITNASGGIEARLSFGSFGRRRNDAGWSGNPSGADWAAITNDTRRGFTEHEMLDNLNLTHMNGRVYDQLVERFVSADPFVQEPGLTQSFNRYAYVLSSPLRYTDPSGYQSVDDYWIPPRCWALCHPDNFEHEPTPRPTPEGPGGGGLPVGPVASVPIDLLPGTHAAGALDGINSTVGGPDDRIFPSFGRGFLGTYRSVVDGPAPWSEQLGRSTQQTFNNLITVTGIALMAVPGGQGGAAVMRVEGAAATTSRALVPYYPINNGFLFQPIRMLLQPGRLIDRFGGNAFSRFFSPAGTPAAMRALPPATAAMELRTFEVLKALEVDAGMTAPAFDQIGLGIQYRSTLTLDELLEQGFIREVVR